MALLQINSALGDSPTRSIPLVVDVEADQTPFTPTVNWVLLLTAKSLLTDPDSAAKFQLQTGLGITHNSSSAVCTLAPTATLAAAPANLYFDIRATHQLTGETHLVARGRWQLVRPATRLAIPSMPIYTTAPGTGPDLSALTGMPAPVKSALAKPIGTLGAVQLVGDVLTPSRINIPDMTGVIGIAGDIGLNGGKLSVADGLTPGGVNVAQRRFTGARRMHFGAQPKAISFIKLVGLPVTPSDLQPGKTVQATGFVSFATPYQGQPIGGITRMRFGTCWLAQSTTAVGNTQSWYASMFDTADTVIDKTNRIKYEISTALRPLVGNIVNNNVGYLYGYDFTKHVVGKASVHIESNWGQGSPAAPAGVANELCFMLQIERTGVTGNYTPQPDPNNNSEGNLDVIYDLTLEVF
jgi:hypothetical protein